jgi:predicted nucleic acid-binding Zn ribbon protein
MLNDRTPNSLNEVLMKLIERMGWQEEYELAMIINNWVEIVGEKFASESKPDNLKDGVLTVLANSSVWRTELFYRREQIIDKICKLREKQVVKEMVIR